jgi:hypothetical protein
VERGLSMAHTTIMRWAHYDAPELERRWNRFALPAGPSCTRAFRVRASNCSGIFVLPLIVLANPLQV